jgi:hypothetical protein
MVGVAPGQVARLNVVNAGGGADPAAGACQVEVSFANAAGAPLDPATFTLVPGQSAFADLPFEAAAAGGEISGNRVAVRAVIAVLCNPSALVPAVQLTLEVYDGETGRASVLVNGGKAVLRRLRRVAGAR